MLLKQVKKSTLLLRSFLRDPAGVSSVLPTAEAAAKRICGKIDGSVRRVIVEYGPGTGVIAERLLQPGKLTGDSVLILIEKNPVLAAHLKRTIHDPRVRVIENGAEHVERILRECGLGSADYVLLSIPLTLMSADLRHVILRSTRSILKEGGALIAFLFHPAVRGYIKEYFPDLSVEWEPLNAPPLFVIEARKHVSAATVES